MDVRPRLPYNIVALICALIMDTGTWLSRSHANGHKNVSRRVNCYNEECAARECAANLSTVMLVATILRCYNLIFTFYPR